MADLFARYARELSLRDLDPKTKLRYWECLNIYRKWLNTAEPDVASAVPTSPLPLKYGRDTFEQPLCGSYLHPDMRMRQSMMNRNPKILDEDIVADRSAPGRWNPGGHAAGSSVAASQEQSTWR